MINEIKVDGLMYGLRKRGKEILLTVRKPSDSFLWNVVGVTKQGLVRYPSLHSELGLKLTRRGNKIKRHKDEA